MRNGLDGLRTLLSVNSTLSALALSKSAIESDRGGLDSELAKLNGAGGEVLPAAASCRVRHDKVAAIREKLARGTYNVPALALASRVVDAMLVLAR